MGYQALLFCPDDKTARTVTQVLSELEFTVEACVETFAAVKKLMGTHFDAVVVDCDNEQNAALLFKSARNSASNQTSLAVAVVEGQAGVAKAFRIGANLVLTKPINIEQAKGTLRVARGLLRKGEPVKPGAASATAPPPAVPASPVKPVAAKPDSAKPAPAKPAAPAPKTGLPPKASPAWPTHAAAANTTPAVNHAASQAADDDDPLEINVDENVPAPKAAAPVPAAPRIPATVSRATKLPPSIPAPATQSKLAPKPAPPSISPSVSSMVASGAASAPAPAREVAKISDVNIASKSGADAHTPALEHAAGLVDHSHSDPAPTTFTFGGNATASEAASGSKKILLVVAAIVAVAAAAYGGWSYYQNSNQYAAPAPRVTSVPVARPSAPAPSPQTSSATPASAPLATTSPVAANSPAAAQPVAQVPATKESASSSTDNAGSNPDADIPPPAPLKKSPSAHATKPAAKPAVAAAPSEDSPAAAPETAPLVVKGGKVPVSKPKAEAAPDAQAPSMAGIATAGAGAPPPNLLSGTENAPTPVLQSIHVSQGVSQGLVVKKVQPIYPQIALTMHVEGAVQLQATISKTGDITGLKVLSGDARLAKAALDAVRQWKYKPYLLDGEPVEIQTTITLNFKAPN